MLNIIGVVGPNTPGGVDALEILTRVENFYQSSWNMLVVTVLILVAFAGILLPIGIQAYQRRTFKKSEKEVMEKIKETEAKMEQKIKEAEAGMKADMESIKEKLERGMGIRAGRYYEDLGSVSSEQKGFYPSFRAVSLFIKAVEEYMIHGEKKDIEVGLGLVERAIELMKTKKEAGEYKDESGYIIEAGKVIMDTDIDTLEMTSEKKGLYEKYKERLEKMKSMIEEIYKQE